MYSRGGEIRPPIGPEGALSQLPRHAPRDRTRHEGAPAGNARQRQRPVGHLRRTPAAQPERESGLAFRCPCPALADALPMTPMPVYTCCEAQVRAGNVLHMVQMLLILAYSPVIEELHVCAKQAFASM